MVKNWKETMTFAYIRVSTQVQTSEGQRYEIEKWCRRRNMHVDRWVEEKISGLSGLNKRTLGENPPEDAQRGRPYLHGTVQARPEHDDGHVHPEPVLPAGNLRLFHQGPFRTVGQHQLENHCFFVFPCRRNRKEPDLPAHPGGTRGQEGRRRPTGPAEGEVKAAEGLRADASGTQEGEGGRGIFQTVSGKGGDSQKHPVQVLESHKRGGTKRKALKI